MSRGPEESIWLRGRNQTDAAFGGVTRNVGGLANTVRRALPILGGLTAALSVQRIAQAADNYGVLSARVRVLGGDFEASAILQQRLLQTSIDVGTAFEETLEQFQELRRFRDDLGATDEQLIQFTASLQEMGAIGGSSSTQIRSGINALNQAFGEGQISTRELRTLLSSMPEFATQLARGLGVTTGQLRQMAIEGKLVSQDVFRVILGQSEEISAAAANATRTMSGAFSAFGSTLGTVIADINQVWGATGATADAVQDITRNMAESRGEIIEAAGQMRILAHDAYTTALVVAQIPSLMAAAGRENSVIIREVGGFLGRLQTSTVNAASAIGSQFRQELGSVVRGFEAVHLEQGIIAQAAAEARGEIEEQMHPEGSINALLVDRLKLREELLGRTREQADAVRNAVGAEATGGTGDDGDAGAERRAQRQQEILERARSETEKTLGEVNALFLQSMDAQERIEQHRYRAQIEGIQEQRRALLDEEVIAQDEILALHEAEAQAEAAHMARLLAIRSGAADERVTSMRRLQSIETEVLIDAEQARTDAVRSELLARMALLEEQGELTAEQETQLKQRLEFLELEHTERVAQIREDAALREQQERVEAFQLELETMEEEHEERLAHILEFESIEQMRIHELREEFRQRELEAETRHMGQFQKLMINLRNFERMTMTQRADFVLGTLQELTAGISQHSRAAFNVNKVAAIANAVVNTAAGVTKALDNPWPLNLIAAASVAAFGAAQIATISSTQFGGGATGLTTSGPGTGVPSMAAQSAFETPTVTAEDRVMTLELEVRSGDNLSEAIARDMRIRINEGDEVLIEPGSRQALELQV